MAELKTKIKKKLQPECTKCGTVVTWRELDQNCRMCAVCWRNERDKDAEYYRIHGTFRP